jgi:hypothetical protein
MAVKKQFQDVLKNIGVTCVEYRVEVECPPDDISSEPWMHCIATGVALQLNGEDWRVLEHIPTGWGGDGKWRVYSARSTVVEITKHDDDLDEDYTVYRLSNREPIGVAKLQRQALTIAVKSGFGQKALS